MQFVSLGTGNTSEYYLNWGIHMTHKINTNIYNGLTTLLYSIGSFDSACFISV